MKVLNTSPYELVYGKEALFPISMEIPALQFLKSLEVEKNDTMEVWLAELLEVQEKREKALIAMSNRQQVVKRWFDKKALDQGLKCKDLVLKFNKRAAKLGQHKKFDSLWEGPFKIIQCKKHNACKLENMEKEGLGILVNRIHLKLFN